MAPNIPEVAPNIPEMALKKTVCYLFELVNNKTGKTYFFLSYKMVRKKESDIFKLLISYGNKKDLKSAVRDEIGIKKNSSEDKKFESMYKRFKSFKDRMPNKRVNLTGNID